MHPHDCRPGASFPKSVFENKTERGGEEERREIKEKERRKRNGKGRSGASKQPPHPYHGPSVARTKRALLFG
jgi:hypothetical protein